MTNYIRTVNTGNGTYSVGMTAEQAKQQSDDCYKNWIGQDFTDIDQDGNGVLSLEEILKANVKQQKRVGAAKCVGGTGNMVLGCAGVAGGLTAEVPSLGISTGIAVAGAAAFYTGTYEIADGIDDINDAQKMLKDYYNDQKAQAEDMKYKKKNIEL